MAAWITLQALVFTQIFPPFVYADQKSPHSDTLRVIQRGDSKEGAGEIRAGLETGQHRLGQIVQLEAIHPIWPQTGRIDFPNGAFISIDAGAANRFKGSVREAEAAKLLPRDSETNKLLAKLGKYPAGMWPKLAARSLGLGIVSVVGHEKDRVMAAYREHDPNIVFVEQPKPLGTGHAAYHGLAALRDAKAPFVVISAGDQPGYNAKVFQLAIDAFQEGQRLTPPVDLVTGTAIFNDPATRRGKGRIVKDAAGRILGILEQKDIEGGATLGGYTMEQLLANPEGNASIYVGRPELLIELLSKVSNANRQNEFYLTDIVGMLIQRGGRVETAQIPEANAPDLTTIQDFWRVEPSFLQQQAGLEQAWDRHPEVQRILARYPSEVRGVTAPETLAQHVERVLQILQLLSVELDLRNADRMVLRVAGAIHDVANMAGSTAEFQRALWELAREKIPGTALRLRDLIDHFKLNWQSRTEVVSRTLQSLADRQPGAGESLDDVVKEALRSRNLSAESSPTEALTDSIMPYVKATRILNELGQSGQISLDPSTAEADRQVIEAMLAGSDWPGLLETQPDYTRGLRPGVADRAKQLSEILEVADVIEASINLAKAEAFFPDRPRDLANVLVSLAQKLREQAISPELAEKALSFLNPKHQSYQQFKAILANGRKIGQANQKWTELDENIMQLVQMGRSRDMLEAAQQGKGSKENREALITFIQQAGLETKQSQTVEQAARKWFHPKAGRAEEKKLEAWLRQHGEQAIHDFMKLIARDRGISVQALGPYYVQPLHIDVDQLKAAAQQNPDALKNELSGRKISPEQYYEYERLKLMAAVAIQVALGRIPIVDLGMGYVGMASGLVHSHSIAQPERLPPAAPGKRFRSPIREKNMHPFFAILFQRPTGSFYKILLARQGIVPLDVTDPNAEKFLKEGLDQGTLFATPLAESSGVARVVLGETELEPKDRNADDPLESRVDEETTLRLLDRTANLVANPETLILIVSTVTPGFTNRAAQLVGKRARVAHAPTRLQPGPTWTRWLEFQRLAAPANADAKGALGSYLEILYSDQNRHHFEILETPPPGGPYLIHSNPVAIEAEKSWENFWRNRLYELGVMLLQMADELGFNAWEVAREIARARPGTHGLTDAIAHLVGGFCVTNQQKQILTGLWNELVVNVGQQFSEMELQRFFRSALAATVVLAARPRDFILDHLFPALERVGKRPNQFRLLLGGVAYRQGTDETRQGGPEAVARHVRDIAGPSVQIFAADPRVTHWLELAEQDISNPGRLGYGLKYQEALRRLQVEPDLFQAILRNHPDVIMMTTRHLEYVGLDPINLIAHSYGRQKIVYFDTFDFSPDDELLKMMAHGWEVIGVGKGHIRTRLAPQVTDLMRLEVAQEVLGRLQSKRKDRRFDARLLRKAVETQRIRIEAYQAGLEGDETAPIRAELATVEQELDFVTDAEYRQVLEAQAQWLRAQLSGQDERARVAQRRFEQLHADYLAEGAAHLRTNVTRPLLLGLSHEMSNVAILLNALVPRVDDPQRLLLPQTVSLLSRAAQGLDMTWRDARQFHRTLDRLAEALLSNDDKQALAHELRVAQIPEDLTVPEPLPAAQQARLKAKYKEQLAGSAGQFVPAFMYIPEERRFRRVVASDKSTMVAAVKFPPDLARSDRDLKREEWGKHLLQVFPNEVDAEVLEYEKYPDFEGLPLEFRIHLDDLVKRGKVLSTLEGTPQNRIGWVMPVNLDPRTPQHRRGRMAFPFFGDDRRPVVGTSLASGAPLILEWKGTGPHSGGSIADLKLQFAELRAGRGKKGVERQGAWQVGGQMGSGEEVITLARLRRTLYYQTGEPAPAVPLARIRYRFKDDPTGAEYEIVLRGAPSSRRLGHRLVDGSGGFAPAEAANKMGWAAAFLLSMDPLADHIALNGDNLYDNATPTDTASFVSVGDERHPKGAFFEYFGYQLSHMLYTFTQIDEKDWDHPYTEYLKDWLDGFFGFMLNLRGEGQIHDPEVFQKYTELTPEDFAAMTDPEKEFVQPLLNDLWKYYVAPRVLEHRVSLHGYDPTWESAYTTNNEAKKKSKYHPELKDKARAFLRYQREVLILTQRRIQEKKFPPILYLWGPRAGQPFNFRAAFKELDRKEQRLEQLDGDYSEIYQLSFYPPRKKEYYDIVDPESRERIRIAWYRHQRGYEKPSAAVQARARAQRQLQRQKGNDQRPPVNEAAGLEGKGLQQVFTLAEWQEIVTDSGPFGLRPFIERQVAKHRVDGELQKVKKLIREAAQRKMFDPNQPVVLVRSPGRARIFMGHPDLPGIGGFSIDTATYQSIWMLVQMTDDGKVVADNVDPAYKRFEFEIGAEDALPKNARKITDRAAWLKWSEAHPFKDKWQGLVKGTFAVIRTKMLDSDETRSRFLKDRGFRVLLSESDIPFGMGFSASSSIPAGLGLAFNALMEAQSSEVRLSFEQLTKLDFAAYPTGDIAGLADITAILMGEKDRARILWYDPDRVGEEIRLPDSLRLFAFESNVRRLDEEDQPAHLKNYAKHIKKLTSISVPLAVLWMRYLSRTKPELRQLEEVLTRNHPNGVVRELTEAGVLKEKKYAQMVAGSGEPLAVGRGAREKREEFVQHVLAQIPNDWTLGHIVRTLRREMPDLRTEINKLVEEFTPLGAHTVNDKTRKGKAKLRMMKMASAVPMRQMAAYGIGEIDRGLKYVQASKDYFSLPINPNQFEKNVGIMLEMMRQAHNGDRALYDPTQPMLAGTLRRTRWGLRQPMEAYQRSLVPIDELINRFEEKRDSTAGRVSGAGLGGLVLGAQYDHFPYDSAKNTQRWLEREGHKVYPIELSAGARVVQLRRVAAGLEGSFELEGATAVARQAVLLQGQAFELSNGAWLDALGDGVIEVPPGTRIEPDVLLRAGSGERLSIGPHVAVTAGARIVGDIEIHADSLVAGQILGTPKFHTILGEGTQIVSRGAEIAPGVILLPVTDESGARYPVTVYGAQIGDPKKPAPIVIWGGTDLRKGVLIRENTILGPFVHVGPSSETKSTVWMGASAKSGSDLAHRAYGGNLIAIPVYLEGTSLEDAWHGQLLSRLAALRFGRVIQRQTKLSTRSGPEVRPLEQLTIDFNGSQIQVETRGINFGDEAGVSNFKSPSGGRKAIGVLSAGVVAGVTAKIQTPAFVGPDSLIDNGAQVSQLQAAAPATYARPIGTTVDRAFRPGAAADLQGKSKGAGETSLFLAGLRTLQTLAQVSVIGLQHTTDSATQAGLRAEIQALHGHFSEIDRFTAKELELLGNSSDAGQVSVLAAQANALRTAWGPILSAAGLEQGPLDVAVAEVQRAAERLDLEFYPQWRGVGPDGKYSPHDPIVVALDWHGQWKVDSARVAQLFQDSLPRVTEKSGVYVYSGEDWVSIAIHTKLGTVREELGPAGELQNKKVAILVGDIPLVDFLSQAELDREPFPKPFVQVLVQGLDAVPPNGYPNVVLAEKGGQGVDAVLDQLRTAIQEGRKYSEVPLFTSILSTLPPDIVDKPINPSDLAIFSDVDNTLMEALDTFDETQAGREDGQIFQADRLSRIVDLGRMGVDFRFNSGKSAQEVSGRRKHNDEDRLLKPVAKALLAAEVSPSRSGYDGAVGVQRGRFDADGNLAWRRVDATTFTDQEAANILHQMVVAVERSIVSAGLEEVRIALPPEALTKSLIILTPKTAGLEMLQGLAQLQPAPGEQLQLAVIVADDAQGTQVAAGLEAFGLRLAVPMINLRETGETLPEAVIDLQIWAWTRTQQLETFVLETLEQLRDLGRFLEIPDISLRGWIEGIRRAATAISA